VSGGTNCAGVGAASPEETEQKIVAVYQLSMEQGVLAQAGAGRPIAPGYLARPLTLLLKKAFMRDSREAFLRAKAQKKRTPARYRLPASISVAALLNDKQSDRQFRRLIRDLLTVTRRLELVRDCFGRRINVTGPQYNLLMTVAELQGAAGVSVGSVAQAMHVSSSFVTAETGKLSDVGLLRKQTNPSDRRGALLKLTPLARTKIHRLLSEIRAVNDLFFGLLTAESFTALCAGAEALVEGSREAMQYIARIEEKSDN
jgi:MarR family transcriptional regulator, organic hydroperoxide resistance regulator